MTKSAAERLEAAAVNAESLVYAGEGNVPVVPLATALAILGEVETVEQRATDWFDKLGTPIDMLLFCPKCGLQHVDAPDERTPDWTNPPHKTHLCHGCQHLFRPSDYPTNGIKEIKSRSVDAAGYKAEAQESRWQPIESTEVAREIINLIDGTMDKRRFYDTSYIVAKLAKFLDERFPAPPEPSEVK